ncbi:MAG TPA: hypothetical protein VMF13_17080, partial [Luteitalea sp.]|nr:hypothetical protein [Luteitalea sp.]
SYARPELASTVSDAVLLFGRDGKLWWTVQPTTVTGLNDAGRSSAGPWRLRSVAFAATPPGRVWVAYSHDEPGRQSFVIEVTADGRQSLKYVQSGFISALAHWPAGSHARLAVGGTDLETGQASLALVASDGTAARWPVSPTCDQCPTLPPAAYYLFPTSEMQHVTERARSQVMRIQSVANQLRVETEDGARPALLAWVDADLRATEVLRPSAYWAQHRRYEARGRIDHTPHECPERRGPTAIRAWRPATGWTHDAVTLLPNLPERRPAETSAGAGLPEPARAPPSFTYYSEQR